MKTVVLNATKQSKYVFNNDRVVTIGSDDIQIGADALAPHHDKTAFGVQDLDSSNCTLYTGITPPDDWSQDKYLFDGTSWTPTGFVPTLLGVCSNSECGLKLPDHTEHSPYTSSGRRKIGFPEKCPLCGSTFNAPANYNAPSD